MKAGLKSLGALAPLMLLGSPAHSACAPTDFFCYESGPTGSLVTQGQLTKDGYLQPKFLAFPSTSVVGITSTTVVLPTSSYNALLSTSPVGTVVVAGIPSISTATAVFG